MRLTLGRRVLYQDSKQGRLGERTWCPNVFAYSVPRLLSLPNAVLRHLGLRLIRSVSVEIHLLASLKAPSPPRWLTYSPGQTPLNIIALSHCVTFSYELLLPLQHMAFLFHIQGPLKNKTCFCLGFPLWPYGPGQDIALCGASFSELSPNSSVLIF